MPNRDKKAAEHVCTNRCCAEPVPYYFSLGEPPEQRFVCPHCGDVTDEPRCPHDTPKQDSHGLDI
jgi:hypothetical protein